MKNHPRAVLLLGLVLVALAFASERGEAHKPITSKYTYNDDVFPIFRDRCGRCHVRDGIAPMSLLTYNEAYPWAESIRGELMAGHMPPWNAEDGIGAFRSRPSIVAREIDTLLTWATGGTPVGNPLHAPPDATLMREWPMGPPGLVLPLPGEFVMPADRSEETRELTLPTYTTEARWVRAVDLLPGTPAIVRNATVAIKSAPENVLAVWLPGEDPAATTSGTAFRLPAGAELLVRIHYKKSYKYEGQSLTDRSTVGLYFAREPAVEVRSWIVASPPVTGESGDRVSFNRTIDEDVEAVALHADPALTNVRLQVDEVSPDGVRTPVIRFVVRPDWTRRYWFERPLVLRRGSRIEIVAVINGADELLLPSASPTPAQPATGSPVRVTFDVVPVQGVTETFTRPVVQQH